MTEYIGANVDAKLEEICKNVHSNCNDRCPVYKVNHEVPDSMHNFKKNKGCDCFEDGKSMRLFILGAIGAGKSFIAIEEKNSLKSK